MFSSHFVEYYQSECDLFPPNYVKLCSLQCGVHSTKVNVHSYIQALKLWCNLYTYVHAVQINVVLSPDLIRRVYRFQYKTVLKPICAGIGFGSGTETKISEQCSKWSKLLLWCIEIEHQSGSL